MTLHWENADTYGGIATNCGGRISGTSLTAHAKRPPPEKRAIPPRLDAPDMRRDNLGLRRFHVIGCQNGVLSNAGVITLNYDDNSQEELDRHPFTGGIAPNWKSWSAGDPQGVQPQQGTKGEWKRFEQHPKAAVEPDGKLFYQLLKTRSTDAVGGVCRKFLGLRPGHTYRLSVRMNTFDIGRDSSNWCFSFHAAAHARTVTLTSDQLAGAAPLPDGSIGTAAGQVARYGPGSTTEGRFIERSTGQLELDSQVADITLPSATDTITVWFRCTGRISTGVGFDWIKIKDLGAN